MILFLLPGYTLRGQLGDQLFQMLLHQLGRQIGMLLVHEFHEILLIRRHASMCIVSASKAVQPSGITRLHAEIICSEEAEEALFGVTARAMCGSQPY